MKLQTQFTVPHKILRDIDYVKKNGSFRGNFQERMYWLSNSRRLFSLLQLTIHIDFLLLKDINNIHKFINNRG